MAITKKLKKLVDDFCLSASTPQSQTYTQGDFNFKFPEYLYFIVNNTELVDSLKFSYDRLDILKGEIQRTMRDEYKIKQVILREEGDEPLYILTEEGEFADNFFDLWVPVFVHVDGMGDVDGVYANNDTNEGQNNQLKFLRWYASKEEEIRAIKSDIYGSVCWNDELLIYVPGSTEPAIVDLDAHIEIIGDVTILAVSNILTEQYVLDIPVGAYIYSAFRAKAVTQHLQDFLEADPDRNLEAISPDRYEEIKTNHQQKKHEDILDMVLLGDGINIERRRPRKNIPQPS